MNIYKVGIIGASGYGGNELTRLVLGHPNLKLAYVAAGSSAGKKLSELLPWITTQDDLTIKEWNPVAPSELDLLFFSLPSGQSKVAVGNISHGTKIIDLGNDHRGDCRLFDGWTYGLADIWPEQIRGVSRVANPGCYPTAALTALAPLIKAGLCDIKSPVLIDAKSGISGAGRGGGGETTLGFAEMNEDVSAYKITGHAHVPEIRMALRELSGVISVPVVFTPHLIPMTRGISVACYVRGTKGLSGLTDCLKIAREFYKNSPFVRVTDRPPHTKWALGSNLVFVSYGVTPEAEIITALATIDNLGKGAAGQAVQNANLMLNLDVKSGLEGTPLWP